ncbi:MAG: hypothetical protein HY521_15020 [Proteobacteria bacterium]|nr:hypothetical protein [Pseudomonadota bacterium]
MTRIRREFLEAKPTGRLTPEHKSLIRLLAEKAVDSFLLRMQFAWSPGKQAARERLIRERIEQYQKEPPEPD